MTFDIIVIGKGLIGSAAAKYISRTNLKVAIIGPDEPEAYIDGTVFASHYDSGRVFRQLGKNLAMTTINSQAHKEYPLLQAQSGINFQQGNGCLYINPTGEDDYLRSIVKRAKTHSVPIIKYENGQAITTDFPFLNLPIASCGMYEGHPSGHINPRLLIQAQLKVIEKNKGTIIREVVEKVTYQKENILVQTSNNTVYHGKKVIFAMGAFTNFFGLLKEQIDLTLKSETVILAQLAIEEVERLTNLPSLLYELDIPEIEGIYATQPIKYPDGNYYLKIGANLPTDLYFHKDVQEIKDWFVHGNSDSHIPILQKHLQKILPDLQIKKVLSKRCILVRTNHPLENPYIGTLQKGKSYVAIGNGWSGANSDGSGYVVARLAMDGAYPTPFCEEDFVLNRKSDKIIK